MGNTLGEVLRLTTFGESHGAAMGGVLDGMPAGVEIDAERVQAAMQRRRPGQSAITTQRKEADKVELLSGIFEGKTLGTPIGFVIRNEDQKSGDYSEMQQVYRPSHADYTYDKKYGVRDVRGGGRSSARETANWVAAGALTAQLLPEVSVHAFVSSVGNIFVNSPYEKMDFSLIDSNIVRCPMPEIAEEMIEAIEVAKKQGDTLGGTVTCVLRNVPAGLGEPVFGKLHARLAHAMMSINAVKGFEYGSGFCGAQMRGSEHNDRFNTDFSTQSNLSGGIQGGISNGMDIYFRVAFKPVATLMQPQNTVSKDGESAVLQPKGRHDPCVVPRAVPIVEAMSSLVLGDLYLQQRMQGMG
ncbi:MAG: chorismate synthase [Weeksellaceae bacterium]|nr:chorismate synthase [Weeksellaceae bacterium]